MLCIFNIIINKKYSCSSFDHQCLRISSKNRMKMNMESRMLVYICATCTADYFFICRSINLG
uniref:Uncharacterized protein n=1 Tax=Heterorhabditis bacteriophora TaxID=37862 RepID=A0A1I7WH31_HETBA